MIIKAHYPAEPFQLGKLMDAHRKLRKRRKRMGKVGGGGSPYSTEYASVFSAYTTKPSSVVATAQDTLVTALVTAGVWAKLDVFYLFAAHTNGGGEALINWVNPGTHNATLVNAPAFVAGAGFTGDGATSYIRSHYNPFSDAVHYATNSASAGAWVNTNVDEPSQIMGYCEDVTTYTWTLGMNLRDANTYNCRINQVFGNITSGDASSVGFHVLNRTANNYLEIRKNGGAVTSDTDASSACLTGEIFILAMNTPTVAKGFSTQQCACAFIGGGLTAGEITAFYNALNVIL
jgi:hypothetical protein